MNSFSLLYFSTLSLTLLSCVNDTDNHRIIHINPEKFVERKLTLAEIATDVNYIVLDSTILIDNIIHTEFCGENIFISTRSEGLLRFNHQGRFINRIGRRGNGPAEYIRATSFTLDNEHKMIFIKAPNKILIFDFDGNFIRDIYERQVIDITNIHYLNGKLIGTNPVFNTTENFHFNWIVLDTLGNNIIKKNSSIKGFIKSGITPKGNISYVFDNYIHYWNHFNDTIFVIDSNSYRAKYLFDNNRFRLKPEKAYNDEIMFGKTSIYIVNNIIESKKYLFIQYRQNTLNQLCIYNKMEKIFNKISFNEEEGVLNDYDDGPNFLPMHYFGSEGNEYLLSIIDSYKLKKILNTEKLNTSVEKHIKLKKLANDLNSNENPVFILIKLKK
jgi:hypothetical protein